MVAYVLFSLLLKPINDINAQNINAESEDAAQEYPNREDAAGKNAYRKVPAANTHMLNCPAAR